MRLAAWYAGLFVLSGAALFVLAYVLVARSLGDRDHELVRSTLAEYAGVYRVSGLVGLRGALLTRDASGARADLFVRVLSRDRETVFVSAPARWASYLLEGVPEPSVPEQPSWSKAAEQGHDVELEVASLRFSDGSLLQVGRSTEERLELLARFRRLFAVLLGATFLAALAGGALLTRRAIRPVEELAETLRGVVETGRLGARVSASPEGDAIDELRMLFNAMLDRIESLLDAMRESLDNVAHDLRTPLARLRAIAERALAAGPDAEPSRAALADVLEETDRISGTLAALMDIAEAETGAMKLDRRPVPAFDLVTDVVDLYADSAEDKGLFLRQEGVPGLTVFADRDRMRQVLANLVDNAIKYTPRGGAVRIETLREGVLVVFRVCDTGPGIAPVDLPRIWERLYRGDKSRGERGLGLGLALVRAVVSAHGGSASVESEPGRGSCFLVRLPAASLSPMS